MVGDIVPEPDSKEEKMYVFAHKKFTIAFNKDRIIEVNLTYTDNPVLLERGTSISFTYEVQWVFNICLCF